MGYDFEALESGVLIMILNRHDGSSSERHEFTVEKGKKYNIDYSDVDVRWR